MSIDKIQQGDNLTQSKDLVADNIEKLKQLFPEIVTEGKIDFTVLQDVLGEDIEEEDEYYRFTWAGKAQARREAHKPSTGTLRPAKEESVDWDTTENVYIEGDNLEVLKLLQKSYAGKVKMIYIDPPYNTGKDFVYKDNYKDNLRNYQEVTGQVDNDGNKLSTNSDSDGRYHSNWLNMMYPRLRLARNLLKEDGVIFMSIDDNESYNLKKICDELYGESNFIASLAVQLNPRGRHLDDFVAKTHETLLIYGKNTSKSSTMYGLEKTGKMVDEYDRNDERGAHRVLGLRNRNQAFNPITRPNLYYPIFICPETLSVSVIKDSTYTETALPETIEGVKTCWTWGKDKVTSDNHLLVAAQINNHWQVFRKDYLFDEDGNTALTLPKSLWNEKEISNDYGKKSIKELFNKNVMDFPKSKHFIKKLILCGTSPSDIVLDFFSGSATTAHAVSEVNSEKNSQRKFIQIQLPELINEKHLAFKEGYEKITELGKERIRRAAKKITEENPEKVKNLDLGFKVFKLDSSNIKGWDGNPEDLEANLWDAVSNIKKDRTEEDVLYEILLKYGLDLTLPIEEKTIEGKTVFNVGFGALFICLGDNLTSKVAEGIGKWKEDLNPEMCRVIFKDTGFTDVEKTNSVQTLKRFGITEIKSI
ncbi:adenine-specific DNA-methyltransferase [Lacinutrix venerupis]|uniref:site-specific DNA-methyltransferase n=1 Tax=Lacinutrix venerupis TaxID=1486034 RepID=UPI000EB0CF38|nr:site-specific DNA-methyltransferase [Lacinutrix venerupis]RLJ60911.1 adenine-specific DNA-methyltransferase [Lacinutrix venerupis]